MERSDCTYGAILNKDVYYVILVLKAVLLAAQAQHPRDQLIDCYFERDIFYPLTSV